ncbi:MAG TPA: HAD family phosphatase [Conexibacter sp.]|nr:HAD family phosphatase [Conexibacter sp.]
MTSSLVTNNSQPLTKRPQAAVFDCDGLLVDSQICWERAYARVAAARGRPLDDVRLDRLLGASVAGAAAFVSEDLGEPVGAEELHAALAASFAADPPEPLRGARELIADLAERMPLGVASNGPRAIVLTVLDQLGVRELISAVVSAEETAGDKPQPDVYLEACRRLAVAPGDAVAFEDSPLGAQAARRAGLFVVAVPSVPGAAIDADLTVASLDDAELRTLLGLDADEPAPSAAVAG